MATSSTKADEALSGVAISLFFWLMILAAVLLFAAVSLAPKLATYLALSDQHETQQQELVSLERQHAELERVIAALQDDPHFAAEMARLEFDAIRPGEEILSVDSALALAPHRGPIHTTGRAVKYSPWRPWVSVLAGNQSLRQMLLLGSAMLVVFAFGWMHEGMTDEAQRQ